MADDVKTGIRVEVEGQDQFASDLGTVAQALENAGGAATSAEAEINSATGAVSDLATKTPASATSFENNMADMAVNVISVVSGIVVVVSEVIEALDTLASQTAEYGDGVQKGAQKIDFSTDAYQEWDYILQKNGSSMKKATGAITNLEKNVAKGSDKTTQALDTLGISLEEAQAMSGGDLFAAVVSALQELHENGEDAEATAAAADLLGQSYTSLGTLLTSTGEETEALRVRAQDLGLVMSGEGIEAAVNYQNAMEDLKNTADGIRLALGEQLLPVIAPAKEALLDLLTSVNWSELGASLAAALGPAVQFLNDFIIPIASVALSGVVATLKLLLDLLGTLGNIALGPLEGLFGDQSKLGTLGDGHDIEEYAENVAQAQAELAAAQEAASNPTGYTEVDAAAQERYTDARIRLENATREYNKVKELLGEGSGGGSGEETPTVPKENADEALSSTESTAEQLVQVYADTAGQINDQYIKGVDEASDAAVESVENIHSVMEQNMAILGANAYIWGIDMMTQLATGIADGSNTTVLPAIDDLTEAIKKRLGFSEPEIGALSNFHTFAPDMMKLFAQGIRDGRGLIAAAIGHSFDLGPMIAAQARGTNLNYGGVSVQIYGAPGQSVDELYDVFSYRLARDVADREAVFST